ncbi:helix-turn-helix domain-containing protein [Bifidobacterium psychraerophilum]|uniref:helix-turn-helix domain-containing protein n=1 Tax=Bifidobacterium psychraerophilum TaxID=218140 RepID=UPI0039EA08CC
MGRVGGEGGRPSKLTERQRPCIRELYQGHTLTVQEIVDQYLVSRKTVYGTLQVM